MSTELILLTFSSIILLPGTTSAAGVKAKFLKEIILGESIVAEITPTYAFELLSHMKGGPSIEVLLDLALGNDEATAKQAAEVLNDPGFSEHDADTASFTGSLPIAELLKIF